MADVTSYDEPVKTLAELRERINAIKAAHPNISYIFRGQTSEHPLATSLERVCTQVDGGLSHAREREWRIIREFKRRYHHYASHVPDEKRHLEWLSVMQHHGAPTRLLDWTYSIYVAAYFAAESAQSSLSEHKKQPPKAAVWMLNATWATEATARLFDAVGRGGYIRKKLPDHEDEEVFADTFGVVSTRSMVLPDSGREPIPCICPLSPFRLNERLTIQKGLFTCVGDVRKTFVENLQVLTEHDQKPNVVRFIIDGENPRDTLEELFFMNITQATLFPGLDGFARSLNINVASLAPRVGAPPGRQFIESPNKTE